MKNEGERETETYGKTPYTVYAILDFERGNLYGKIVGWVECSFV